MNDALGNVIILGNTYGATYNNSGRTVIVVGEAIKINKAKTTIKPSSVRFLNKSEGRWTQLDSTDSHTILHECLFPVVNKLSKEEMGLAIDNLIAWYTDDFFNDRSGITTIDVLRANNPDIVEEFETRLRKLINE